ncbi:DUF2798 domain-containing protein [Mesorhizobium sp. M7A.F.Ca.MR.148.00.0.0]|uniref:DUF2798 domain-containing protein n=1 Tax=Mesorhizobium sp. M7A.F.Ca.MR.148.00.0.0 TaxID=2496775 RepID=UPI000FCC9F20|nr:DUF2798 domain-containing protein [Mesorhizobium sp. M7A.F.Ca.MR.148.00.0.0]RUV38534.1 DUF2798 domain-containing protein [Mesorhizobium sp. M7A.F.Ca.MR.148.00.0.0]
MNARYQRRKLPARYAAVLSPLVLLLLMTFIVSFISTLKSLGFHPELPSIWLTAWGLSWLVAFPTLLLVLPIVRRIVGALCKPASR